MKKLILSLVIVSTINSFGSPPIPPINRTRSANLQWNPSPSPNIVNYRLYVSTNNLTWTSNLIGNVTQTIVSNIQPSFTYAYFVTAINQSGVESDPSNVLEVPPPSIPAPPTGVQYSPLIVSVEYQKENGEWTSFRSYTNNIDTAMASRVFRSKITIGQPFEAVNLPR